MGRTLHFQTDLGLCAVTWTRLGLRTLSLLEPGGPPEPPEPIQAPPWVWDAVDRITRFLAGLPIDLGSIPLDLESLPPFKRRVLEALRATQPGETLTYGALARMAGSPGAARAVGQAMARNPLPVLVPCHRVVASDGPGGFSLFGSLETKERLLELEKGSLRSR